MSSSPRITGRLVFGIVVILVGILWTLEGLGMADADYYLRWWPVLLIAFGAMRLLGLDGHKHVALGVIAMAAGFLVLGDEFGLLEVSVWRLWPVALIIVGLAMVSRSMTGRSMFARGTSQEREGDERTNVLSVWSSIRRKVSSAQYAGGEVTAVMGAVELDLRPAGTPPDGATLDMFVWMGGVEIFVPRNMRVLNELTPIMGGVEDGREAPSQETEHTVRLRGFVIWGAVEIKG